MSAKAFTSRSRPKQKGLPKLGEQLKLPELVDLTPDNSNIPYRLPKTDQSPRPSSNRLWGRHGYDYYNRKPEMIDCSEKLTATSLSARQSSLSGHYPKFSHAMINPVSSSQPKLFAGNLQDPAFFKNLCSVPGYSHGSMVGYQRAAGFSPPAPTPMSHYRMSSPDKSVKTNYSGEAIYWALSPYKKVYFDKKGGSRAQGPYSRSMTVTCSAPHNWLRMKWGRSKTMTAR